MTLSSLIKHAEQQLISSENPRLEAELLLCRAIQKPRAFLFAHPQHKPQAHEQIAFDQLLTQRRLGTPIAYLLGHKSFWSIELCVSPSVLIPRPETELLVEATLKFLQPKTHATIAELGTGSGAIALALAQEKPNWVVLGTDQSEKALTVARHNAKLNHLSHVKFYQGNWCEALPEETFDAIVSNPPYIAHDDPHLKEGDLRFEPLEALVSENQGFADLFKISACAPNFLKPEGWLLLEHGYRQGPQLRAHLSALGFLKIQTLTDLNHLERVTLCQKPTSKPLRGTLLSQMPSR